VRSNMAMSAKIVMTIRPEGLVVSAHGALLHVWTAPRMQEENGRGSKSALFWVPPAHGNRRPVKAGFRSRGCRVREASASPALALLELKLPKAQQGQPMRMALVRQQFPWALAVSLRTPAAHEAPMV